MGGGERSAGGLEEVEREAGQHAMGYHYDTLAVAETPPPTRPARTSVSAAV